MMDVKLVLPSEEHEALWHDIIAEFQNAGEEIYPYALLPDCISYGEFLKKTENYRIGRNIPPNHVPADTYFLMGDGESRILGAINIRHSLTEKGLNANGHIGYGVRPSERRKGYAARMLALALEKCRAMGFDRVLVTCDKGNAGSAKTILKNGGVMENEFLEENGNIVERYWVEL